MRFSKRNSRERREIPLVGWPVQQEVADSVQMAVDLALRNSSLAPPSPLARDLRKVLDARGQRL